MGASTINYRRTPKGVLTNIYQHMKARNIEKGYGNIPFTLKEFHCKYLSDEEYLRLCNLWEKSGYGYYTKPSFDRIDNQSGYRLDNLRVMTWGRNRKKGNGEVALKNQKPVIMYNLRGDLEKVFPSVKSAAIFMGMNQSLVSSCCEGRVSWAKAKIFRFYNECTQVNIGKDTLPYVDETGNVHRGKPVICISLGTIYPTAVIAAKSLGIAKSDYIGKVCRGERKEINGLRFKFYKYSPEIIGTIWDKEGSDA